ncbi:MAG: DUF2079 domain-containing protein, partial [Patescibacteria group bacterium]
FLKGVLVAAIFLFAAVFSILSFLKYRGFEYNALDLAIFHQTLWSLAHHHGWTLTIHPPSYLGDHVGLFLILLAPLYRLFSSPATPLIAQSAAIALAAWPLYGIARTWLSPRGACAVSLLWLVNPFVQNITLFEFHELAFALPILFGLLLAYLRQWSWAAIVLGLLALGVREDAAFFVLMLGVLAWMEHRPIGWRVLPVLGAGAWLISAFWISQQANLEGTYKFLIYYQWIGGNTLWDILRSALLHPDRILLHLLTPQNAIFLIAIFLPFFFLPLRQPRWLILTVPYVFQILLAGFGGSELILRTHYSAFFLPPLFVAFAESASAWRSRIGLWRWEQQLAQSRPLAAILVLTTSLYSMLFLGPMLPVARATLFFRDQGAAAIQQWLVGRIPANAPVAASYATLPALAGRETVASLGYTFVGQQQFSPATYTPPQTIKTLLMDTRDFLYYEYQYAPDLYTNGQKTGATRLRRLIQNRNLHLTQHLDHWMLWTPEGTLPLPWEERPNSPPSHSLSLAMTPGLTLLGWTAEKPTVPPVAQETHRLFPLELWWKRTDTLSGALFLRLEFLDAEGSVLEKRQLPLGHGLFPPQDWTQDAPVQFAHPLLIQKTTADQWQLIQLTLESPDAYQLGLSPILNAALVKKNGSQSAVGESARLTR